MGGKEGRGRVTCRCAGRGGSVTVLGSLSAGGGGELLAVQQEGWRDGILAVVLLKFVFLLSRISEA